MALKNNYSILCNGPGKFIGGSSTAGAYITHTRSNYNKNGANRNMFSGWSGISNNASIPNGYNPHYSWVFKIKATNDMASYTLVSGIGQSTQANLAGGLGGNSTIPGIGILTSDSFGVGVITSTLTGTGTISTANITAIADMISTLVGSGASSGTIAAVLYMTATCSGTGNINNAEMQLIVSAVATLVGIGAINSALLSSGINAEATLTGTSSAVADIAGIKNATATITAGGDITAALTAIGNIVASLQGTSTTTANTSAIADISASITPYTALSPESLAASVWNALAVAYNTSGTMGEKLNSAGGGSSPTDIANAVWDTLKTTHTTADTYGKIVQDLETIAKQIKALTSANL